MFFGELNYYVVCLDDARSIAMTSFFSHKTISHLDLQISQQSLYVPGLDRTFSILKKSFFSSEESLRNNLLPERRLLYSLNLDFPHGREYSNLRNGSAPCDLPEYYSSPFLAIRGHDQFFRVLLVSLIKTACEQTDYKLRMLKWMVKFRPLKAVFIPHCVQRTCAKTLYRECGDSEFAVKFFERFIDFSTFGFGGELKNFEYLLYHARLCAFDVKRKVPTLSSLTDYCLDIEGFRLVNSILKYEDTAYYTETSYEAYKESLPPLVLVLSLTTLRLRDEEEEMSRPENWMSKLRLYRMLQIIYMYVHHEYYHYYGSLFDLPYLSEALRLIWSSIPDSFVSLQDMNDAFEHVLPAEFIIGAHSFYEETIRQTVSCREPRSLTQYCRTVIRKSVYDSKQWLPDGIEQLKLPPRFHSFLNLQRDNLRLENLQALLPTDETVTANMLAASDN